MQLSGTTTLLGLIGSPVAHSKSPAMYNYCFRKFHMDCAYLAFDVAADQVEQSVKAIRTLVKWQGLSVKALIMFAHTGLKLQKHLQRKMM